MNSSQATFDFSQAFGANIILIIIVIIAWLIARKKKSIGVVVYIIGIVIQTISIIGQAEQLHYLQNNYYHYQYESIENQFYFALFLSTVIAAAGLSAILAAKNKTNDKTQEKNIKNEVYGIIDNSAQTKAKKDEEKAKTDRNELFCRKCGSELVEGSAFCRKCGAPVVVKKDAGEIATATEESIIPPESRNVVLTNEEKSSVSDSVIEINLQDNNLAPKVKRAFLFIEDGDWEKAESYLESVLDEDPTNAYAYIGKLMVEYKISKTGDLVNFKEVLSDNKNYQKAVRFSNEELSAKLNALAKPQEDKQHEPETRVAIEVDGGIMWVDIKTAEKIASGEIDLSKPISPEVEQAGKEFLKMMREQHNSQREKKNE